MEIHAETGKTRVNAKTTMEKQEKQVGPAFNIALLYIRT